MLCTATSDGHFFALDVKTGKLAWQTDQVVPALYKRTWAFYNGSVIFFRVGAPLAAYNAASGAKGTSYGSEEDYVMTVAVSGNVVYALGTFSGVGTVSAYHADTGGTIWKQKLLTADETAGTSLLVSGGLVFLGTSSGALHALDAGTGSSRWTYHPGNRISADLGVDGALVFVKDDNGTVHAVDIATGKQAWSYPAPVTSVYGLTAANGRVYFSTLLALQALDAKTGKPVWTFRAPAEKELLSTPAVADGLVYIGCSDDALYAVKA
jgi:outer membrane protein assembly factor BamB